MLVSHNSTKHATSIPVLLEGTVVSLRPFSLCVSALDAWRDQAQRNSRSSVVANIARHRR